MELLDNTEVIVLIAFIGLMVGIVAHFTGSS